MDEEKKKEKPIYVLCWMDSPAVSTGFGSVARGILRELAKTGRYEIEIIGINDGGGWKNPEEHPYKIYPAKTGIEVNGDYYGRTRLIGSVLGKDKELKPPWDIVFLLNDPFILEEPVPIFGKGTFEIVADAQEQFRKKLPPDYHYKTVYYIPIDSPIRGNWVEKAIAKADYPVAYSKYGKTEIEKSDVGLGGNATKVGERTEVIYHGIDTNIFKPLDAKEKKEFRDKYFKGVVYDHTFLVTAIARNQMRKDLPRTFAIFKEFQKRRPDSFLYLHCQLTDAWGNLKEYARNFNLEFGKDWGVPANFDANKGFSMETVNKIYNASDVVISTTLGEGWGFYNSEAFATKTAVLAPDNTVHPEIFGYEGEVEEAEAMFQKGVRGMPYKCHSTTSEWASYGPVDLERVRPLGNVDDAVKKLVWIYDNPDKVAVMKERAYEWVQQYSWEKVAQKWDGLLQRIYADLKADRDRVIRKIANEQKPRKK